jgi:hypothetical protein
MSGSCADLGPVRWVGGGRGGSRPHLSAPEGALSRVVRPARGSGRRLGFKIGARAGQLLLFGTGKQQVSGSWADLGPVGRDSTSDLVGAEPQFVKICAGPLRSSRWRVARSRSARDPASPALRALSSRASGVKIGSCAGHLVPVGRIRQQVSGSCADLGLLRRMGGYELVSDLVSLRPRVSIRVVGGGVKIG